MGWEGWLREGARMGGELLMGRSERWEDGGRMDGERKGRGGGGKGKGVGRSLTISELSTCIHSG